MLGGTRCAWGGLKLDEVHLGMEGVRDGQHGSTPDKRGWCGEAVLPLRAVYS